MYFIASTGGNDSLGLGYSDDGLDWKLYGDTPVISGLIDPQPWEGENGYISFCHVARLEDGRGWMLYSGAYSPHWGSMKPGNATTAGR